MNLRWARAALIVVGAAVMSNAFWLALTANITLGTGLVALTGSAFVGWGIWLPRLSRHSVVTGLSVVVLAAVVGLSSFLAIYGSSDDADPHAEAVIVLGAAVHGDELSRTLQGRLDAALAYYRVNPSALIAVSGGQGFQENLPEAVAMQRYLVEHGVPSGQILVEDRATSTQENFAFSQALLDQRLSARYKVVVVTDDFHVYRATRLAVADGLRVTHVSHSTPWYFLAADYLREDVMVLRLWLTGS